MHKAWEACLKSIEKAQDIQKEQFDKRAQDLKLGIGQTVTMKRFKPAPNPKFASPRKDPVAVQPHSTDQESSRGPT